MWSAMGAVLSLGSHWSESLHFHLFIRLRGNQLIADYLCIYTWRACTASESSPDLHQSPHAPLQHHDFDTGPHSACSAVTSWLASGLRHCIFNSLDGLHPGLQEMPMSLPALTTSGAPVWTFSDTPARRCHLKHMECANQYGTSPPPIIPIQHSPGVANPIQTPTSCTSTS